MKHKIALSPEASSYYERISTQWGIADAAGELTLSVAMQALDRLREAQRLIERDGAVCKDRFGQLRCHPAAQLEKESRAGLLLALKSLGLDLESLGGGADAT